MVFYAVGESFRVAYTHENRDLDVTLRKASDPSWYVATDDPLQAVIRKHYKLASTSLREAYEKASEKGGDFRHRNWFRSDATLKAVRLHLEQLWGIVGDSPEQYLF
jgi:hypothetical protein